MLRSERRPNPGRYRAFAYALLVHAIVITGLIIGFSWNSKPVGNVEQTIQAKAVEDPEKKKIEDEHRRAEEERKKAEAEKKRQDLEAQKKREEEKRIEERRKKDETEKQRLAEQKRKQEEELKRREDERKADAEKKRQAESQRAAADELKKQLEKEEGERVEAARVGRAQTELDKVRAAIKRKVSQNWSRPPNIPPGLQCELKVRLGPGGVVLDVTLVKGSGNAIFDRSVAPAIYKASPLPIPQDPELFQYYRDLPFVFRPE